MNNTPKIIEEQVTENVTVTSVSTKENTTLTFNLKATEGDNSQALMELGQCLEEAAESVYAAIIISHYRARKSEGDGEGSYS